MKLHIQHGRVIDPASGLDAITDVCISDGVIVAVGAPTQGFLADRVINATGKLVLPGLVDLCARLSATTAHAALAGGVTSVVMPPDLFPVLDTPERARSFFHEQNIDHSVNVFPLGALTLDLAGQSLTEMVGLAEAGCIAFSQASTPIQDTAVLMRAMQYASTFDYALWMHPNDYWLSRGGVAASGAYAARLGLAPIPAQAETIALHTLLSLQRATGTRLHLSCLSSAEAIEMVRAAKKEGRPVTCDVSANHVHLTDVDIGFYDSNFRLEPPLRGQRDRDAIRYGLLDGTIDAVCSDHRSISTQEKLRPFAESVPGSIGLELLLSLMLKWAQESRMPLSEALKLLTSGPGRVLALAAHKQVGGLTIGAPADLCVVDPEEYWVVGRDTLISDTLTSESIHTPFVGRELPGRVHTTILRGEVLWERPS